MSTSRAEAYAALDSERDYQDMRKDRDNGQPSHSPEEYLVYMQDYLNEALHTSARTWGPEAKVAVMEIVRKVTALGVACMEDHGVAQRQGFKRRPLIVVESHNAASTKV